MKDNKENSNSISKIDGINEIRGKNWAIYYINELTECLKDNIRKNLSLICQGPDPIDDSYKATASEFIKRCESRESKNRIVGMIGEFLVHLIVLNYYDYEAASILFNAEERSFKKGFDILFYQTQDKSLWITEVKSGEVSNGEKADKKLSTLIDKAKNDLKGRLNDKDSKEQLWRNAYSHAKLAIIDSNNEKAAIINIIRDNFKRLEDSKASGSGDNVILSSVLFHTLTEQATSSVVEKKQNNIFNTRQNKDKLFKNVIVIAVQEETCFDVLNFLKDDISE